MIPMIPKLRKILYVEDQPDIQLVAKMAMVKHGMFEVKACSSGPEALEAAVWFEPDLLLLDVMMPGMDGLATLALLRKIPATATTPAVFFTARADASAHATYLAAGAIDLIPKPFDPVTLSGAIEAIWTWHQKTHGCVT